MGNIRKFRNGNWHQMFFNHYSHSMRNVNELISAAVAMYPTLDVDIISIETLGGRHHANKLAIEFEVLPPHDDSFYECNLEPIK